MPAVRKIIGKVKCQCCREDTAAKEQANGLACYSCSYCLLFVQAHGPEADKFIRSQVSSLRPGEPAPGEVKAAASSSSAPPPSSSKSEPAEERTIFDLLKPRAA